jgi:O-antigen ligase
MTYIVCVFFMIMPTGALSYIDRMIYGEWKGKPGDRLTEALNLLAIVVSLLLFWWGLQRVRGPRFNRVLPLVAAGLLVISTLWSVAPVTTATRSSAYFFLVVGAIGIVELLDADEVMRLTALIGGLAATVSLLLLFVLPDTVMTEIGLRGVFSQKNVLGQAMVVGVFAGLHGIRIGGRRRFRHIIIVALCTIVAFLSRSTTSLLTIFAFLTLHILCTLYIRAGYRRMISISLSVIVAPTFALIVMNADFMFSFLEKNETLTGRTELWPYVFDYIYQRPVLGWGFAAFWIRSNPFAAEISSMLGWDFSVNEAHNGMLQLLLDIGVVGTAFFLYLWVRNFIMALKCMNGRAPEIGVSGLLCLVGILLIGISEQVLTTADGATVQFFLLGFMCEKAVRFARQPSATPRYAGLRLDQLGALRKEDVV